MNEDKNVRMVTVFFSVMVLGAIFWLLVWKLSLTAKKNGENTGNLLPTYTEISVPETVVEKISVEATPVASSDEVKPFRVLARQSVVLDEEQQFSRPDSNAVPVDPTPEWVKQNRQ